VSGGARRIRTQTPLRTDEQTLVVWIRSLVLEANSATVAAAATVVAIVGAGSVPSQAHRNWACVSLPEQKHTYVWTRWLHRYIPTRHTQL